MSTARRAFIGGIFTLSALTLAAPIAAQPQVCSGGGDMASIVAWHPTNLVVTRSTTDINNGTVTLTWRNPCSNLPSTGVVTLTLRSNNGAIDSSLAADNGGLWSFTTTDLANSPLPTTATVSSGTFTSCLSGSCENFDRQPLPAGVHQFGTEVDNGASPVLSRFSTDPITICPTAVRTCTPTISRAAHSVDGIVLEWDKPAGVTGGFDIYYDTQAGVTAESRSISRTLAESGCTDDASCTHTIPYGSDFSPSGTYYFRVEAIGAQGTANPNAAASPEAKFGLSAEANAMGTAPPSGGNGDSGGRNPQPAADSGGSSSGGTVLVLAAIAGGIYYLKNRPPKQGEKSPFAFLPDVSFDLDRNDNRAFYTKMNWQKSGNSNWQLRGSAKIHTKYDGKLLDWNANSHIGYRLNGKFGEFNPYMNAKFVQNAPENAKMDETYTVGVNYAIPNRFSVQFLQPDDEIWRYSLKTQVHLPRGISLQLDQPDSDIWRYSANLNWQVSERIGLNLSQPNNDLPNYGFGVQWRNKSKIRYGISGETGSNSYKFSGEFSF